MQSFAWLKTQFDKLLFFAIFLAGCGLAQLTTNQRIEQFALSAAGGALSALGILVTGRHLTPADPFSASTSGSMSSTVKTETVIAPSVDPAP